MHTAHLSGLTLFSLFVLVVMLGFNWMQDEKELAENNSCPVHLKPCVARKEDNYFFALSKYQHKLEELLARNPDFVRPSHRLNEVRFYFYLLYAFVLSFCDYWVTVHQCNCGGNYRLQKMQTYQVIWVQTRKNSKKNYFYMFVYEALQLFLLAYVFLNLYHNFFDYVYVVKHVLTKQWNFIW